MYAKTLFKKKLYMSYQLKDKISSRDIIICSLNNNGTQNIYSLFQSFKTNNGNTSTNMTNFEGVVNGLCKERLLKKYEKDGIITYSLSKDINSLYRSDPSYIVANFNPLPPLKNKSYLVYLLSNQINPFMIYPEEQHKFIENQQSNIQNSIDKYKNYITFKLYPQIAEKISKENPNLYDILVEKNKLWPYLNFKNNKKTLKNFGKLKSIKNKTFKEVFKL